MSAFRSKSSALSSAEADATPMLTVTRTWLPLSLKGWDMAAARLGKAIAALGSLDQDGELIPAESGHCVRTAGAGKKSLRGGDEEPVDLSVTQAIVDVLEVVQIQVQNGYRRAAALG